MPVGRQVRARPVDAFDDDAFVRAFLQLAAATRTDATVLPPTDRQVDTWAGRDFDAATAPVSPERILQLNTMAADFWAAQLPGSWAQTYLTDRVGVDLTGDRHVQPGYAPAGWTTLVDHLHTRGATDDELTAAGLATVARTGRLIDRFRDRLVLPITRPAADGQLAPLGFVARRHPDAPVDRTTGPKYLNTPDTVLFHKGAQLYVVRHDLLTAGATLVLVEGPLDALAISLSGQGRYVGLAPLGTSLTDEQARQLTTTARHAGVAPLVATDADLAGHLAAQRHYWLLAQHAATPATIALRPGTDPAQLLATDGRQGVLAALEQVSDLADTLLDERLTNLIGPAAVREATQVLAAASPTNWDDGVDKFAAATGTPVHVVRRDLARAVQRWDTDPRTAAEAQIAQLSAVRERINAERRTTEPGSAQKITPRSLAAPTPPPDPQRTLEAPRR